jgi:hypothetical protein
MPLLKKKKADKEGNSLLEGKITAVKEVFEKRNLKHVIQTPAVGGAKAKALKADDLVKKRLRLFGCPRGGKGNKLIKACCDRHDELSSARAQSKASKCYS